MSIEIECATTPYPGAPDEAEIMEKRRIHIPLGFMVKKKMNEGRESRVSCVWIEKF
jgi:hypothetical protein